MSAPPTTDAEISDPPMPVPPPAPTIAPTTVPASAPRGVIPSLDGFRFLAVLVVFLGHVGLSSRIPGGFGVTVFFFLSGYLITTLLTREHDRHGRIAFGAFFARRAVRLLPPLLVTLAAAAVLAWFGLVRGDLDPRTFASQILFYYNYYAIYGDAGTSVSCLQQALTDQGFYTGPVSGTFDQATFTAVEAMQTDRDLYVDGIVGRESAISVSNPAAFGEATDRAKERLNRELSQHGLVVTQIVTPRPQFNDEYEKLIEERNALGNQLEVIKSNLAAAETKRERRLAEVERDQNRQIQEKRTELEAALATAVSDQADTVREVDTYRMSKVGEGQAQLKAATKQAEELKGQLAANYDERKAQIDAFRTQPIERVMERLGQRLKGVTINIQPYADDSTPSRVRMEQIGR